MTSKFRTDLKRGNKGEEILLDVYPTKLIKHENRDGDFICTETNLKIELKTDYYDMNKTDNFFIERFSDVYKQSPGGPWQAEHHGCDVFIYMFINNNSYFKFSCIHSLLERLNQLILDKGLKFCYIKNQAWTTAGYKVSREDLKDLYTEEKF